jgi:hypothetical protein
MKQMANLIPLEYIGGGLYMIDTGYNVAIAVGNHKHIVAYIDIDDIDKAIDYLNKVKERLKAK